MAEVVVSAAAVTAPKLVKALYNFRGQNNDELCFNKGDTITVTQTIEGGWWEGTLNGLTGWFPSNYTKEIKLDGRSGTKSPTGKPPELVLNKRESILVYHNIVVKDILDSERKFVGELQTLWQTYLVPLRDSEVLQAAEFGHLCGNIEEVVNMHQTLLNSLDECAKLPASQQRIGGLFIKHAPQIKNHYSEYCSNHPKAAAVLHKKREELNKYMESKGANGAMSMTTQLSKPFTRLDKYQNLLKEMERHTEDNHVDRGDTQRAISVYRELALFCVELRKRKELELDILTSSIQGWEGEEITQLGDSMMLSHVCVHCEDGEKKEQLFMLFPSVLVVLTITPRMSAYIYQGKLPVSGMTVNPLEDTETFSNAFEITGCMIDRRVVSCHSKHDQVHWVDLLRQQAKSSPVSSAPSSKPQSLQISTSQPTISPLSQAKMATVIQQQPYKALKTTWTMSCLRPSIPFRPPFLLKDDPSKSPRSSRRNTGATKRKAVDDCKVLEEDALVLRVIEAYCTSAKTRHTVNSSLLDAPQVLIAEEEKIIVEETKGDQTVVEEKTLVDTVYSLKDTVKDLKFEQNRLRKDLEDERRARKRLETMIRKSMKSLVETAGATIVEESSA